MWSLGAKLPPHEDLEALKLSQVSYCGQTCLKLKPKKSQYLDLLNGARIDVELLIGGLVPVIGAAATPASCELL